MSSNNEHSLGSCLLMDGIGCLSYILPGIGEGLDIVWAFVGGVIFYNWFKSSAGTVGAIAEELIPFTDFIPAFTIGYFVCRNND